MTSCARGSLASRRSTWRGCLVVGAFHVRSARRPILDWLTLQPDLQYLIHAGAATSLRNAWVVGLRFEVSQSTD